MRPFCHSFRPCSPRLSLEKLEPDIRPWSMRLLAGVRPLSGLLLASGLLLGASGCIPVEIPDESPTPAESPTPSITEPPVSPTPSGPTPTPLPGSPTPGTDTPTGPTQTPETPTLVPETPTQIPETPTLVPTPTEVPTPTALPVSFAPFDACAGTDCNGHGTCTENAEGYGACTCEEGFDTVGLHCWAPPETPATWLFMVYLDGDNDLEEWALEDLQELMEAGSSEAVTVLALVDRASSYSSEAIGGISDWSTAKLLKVKKGSLEELEDWGEVDMSASDTLARFVQYGLEEYPSSRAFLDLWNHGGGWYGFGWDDSSGGFMGLQAIQDGILAGLEDSGEDHLEVVGFDACLLGMLEVAEALEPAAHYLLASEEVEPGHGWDYAVLSELVDDPTLDGAALNRLVMDGFLAQAEDYDTHEYVTLSSLNLSVLPRVRRALYDALVGLSGTLLDTQDEVARAYTASEQFGYDPDPVWSYNNLDLTNLNEGVLGLVPAYADAGTALKEALSSLVEDQVRGEDHAQAGGLAVYFPARRMWYSSYYEAVGGMEHWRTFLDAFWRAGEAVSLFPHFLNPNHQAEVSYPSDALVTLRGNLDPLSVEGLQRTEFAFSVLVEDLECVLARTPALYDGTTQEVSFTWNHTLAMVSQPPLPPVPVYAQFEPTDTASELRLLIPLYYFPDGVKGEARKEAKWVVTFNTDTMLPTSSHYYLIEETYTGELSPVPGSELQPRVPVIQDPDQPSEQVWRALPVPPFSATRGLLLTVLPLPKSLSWAAYLFASDGAGHTDYVTVREDD